MSDTTSQVTIKLLATGDLAAFATAKGQAEELRAAVEGVKRALEVVGIGTSVFALAEFAKGAAESAVAMSHLAEQAQISVSAFQNLNFMALAAGMQQDELAKGLEKMNLALARAEQGAKLQNEALHNLGLSTAELLAMPEEERLHAIAVAYEESTDKGRAMADLQVIFGRNAAHYLELLKELANSGVIKSAWAIPDEDVKRLKEEEETLTKILQIARNLAAIGISKAGPAIVGALTGTAGVLMSNTGSGAKGMPTAEEVAAAGPTGQADAAAKKKADMAEELAASAEMISAHERLTKALQDENAVKEDGAQKATRLRSQAAADEARAAAIHAATDSSPGEYKADQVEAVNLQAEAAKLRAQANKEQAQWEKQVADNISKEHEMAQKLAEVGARNLSLDEQRSQASERMIDVEKQLAALDPASLTYAADHLSLEAQELEIKKQIQSLDTKIGEQQVVNLQKQEAAAQKAFDIQIRSVESNWNATDNEKWHEKNELLKKQIAEQESYIANLDRIANDPSKPQSVREKAGQAGDTARNTLGGLEGEKHGMGPNPSSFSDQYANEVTKYQNSLGTVQQQMAVGLVGAEKSVGVGLDAWIRKTDSFSHAMKTSLLSVWNEFESGMIKAFAQMVMNYGVSKIAMFAIDEAMAAKGLLLSAASAAKSLIMWLPSAIAASISSWGIAAAIGAAAVIGIVAASGGFEEGGYTGGSEGVPAGIVHGGEYVFSAPAVRNIGADNLERAHQAALNPVASGGGGGGSSGRSSSGGSGSVIVAMSSEDVARSQRSYVDSRVVRMANKRPGARVKL